jgi:tagatose-1,6-bisphosphate aldolase
MAAIALTALTSAATAISTWQTGHTVSVWDRLLLELSMIAFFALEEAVFDGNVRGGTPSLVAEWSARKAASQGSGCASGRAGGFERSSHRLAR